MKLRFVAYITIIAFIISMGTGLYYKSLYKDFNTEEESLDKFVVGLLPDELLETQIEFLEEELDFAPIIIAGKCDDTFTYRFSSTTQKITIEYVYKGENLAVGDHIEIARGNSNIYLDEDGYINGKPSINMGFANEMVPGNTYLIFLDRQLETHNEDDIIYIQDEKYIITPIFCYEEIENIPCISINGNGNFAEYKDVRHNEFFLMSENGIYNMNTLKEKLLKKYPI